MPQYTQTQYDALCTAIAQGVMTVKYGDKEITYRSLGEMERIKKLMAVDLGIKTAPRRTYISQTKGLC